MADPRRTDPRHPTGQQRGGIPDGLLLALLAFLLGLAVLVWSATGLAAWITRGAWPGTVTFGHTPAAIRALIAQPHDVAGAWPDTDPAALSGWGLFWGTFISQLLVLFVATVFVIGVVARTKSRRAQARQAPEQPPAPEPAPFPVQPVTAYEPPRPAPRPAAPQPPAPTDEAYRYGFGYAPATPPAPSPSHGEQRLQYADPDRRHQLAAQSIVMAEGAALIVTSSPALWAETKDARAKLGPVLLYDPAHLCDTPARMHWNPAEGCAERDTAAARAAALLAPVRPQARIDAAVADTAETLLRSWLHAVALDSRPFKQLHRWAQGTNAQEPVRILRTHPHAAPGAAGELESALTAHPERRELAQHLTARALSCLSSINVREACNPNRTDSLTLASFLTEGGSLYVVGEPLEDPRTHPGAMPLLTALTASVVEHGRRMAARSSHGRLDPPLSLVLDDIAAVAPIPQLPELLADATGLPVLALCRSREQARSRWPEADLPLPAH
ncbi:type IV secretory system conjugative DNA transfer family protein [Streptomyces sp. NBC_00536]|uniref:type VI secretion protein n=1 Tax=Streptomyces sp. NBC_00536 TaxID=2975769 RepID=UPI002E81C015|nr:type VI secretion protein [Streptomyces sp. NBC_00536]WUC80308.1 type IV secretory system conjugative DNA transfer family protein [Streptomyces sp. NBC_00536]